MTIITTGTSTSDQNHHHNNNTNHESSPLLMVVGGGTTTSNTNGIHNSLSHGCEYHAVSVMEDSNSNSNSNNNKSPTNGYHNNHQQTITTTVTSTTVEEEITNTNSIRNSTNTSSIFYELYMVFQLAIPTIFVQIGNFIPSFILASYIGIKLVVVQQQQEQSPNGDDNNIFMNTTTITSNITDYIVATTTTISGGDPIYDVPNNNDDQHHESYYYLDGYMIANLTANLCTLTILQGIMSACDTLLPQSYGAKNYQEVGYTAYRGYIVSLLAILPMNVCILYQFMESILLYIGQNPIVAYHAATWYRIYMIAFPFIAFQQVIWKFLSAQNRLLPLVMTVFFGSCCILPLLLHILCSVYQFGFLGTAWAVVGMNLIQVFVLMMYMILYQPYHPDTIVPFNVTTLRHLWNHYDTFHIFLKLSIGGMLASSEWIYWEIISLMIGTMGPLQLTIHTIPTQILNILFMIPLSIGIALAIRLGNVLPHSVPQAQLLCLWTVLTCTIGFFGMCCLMYQYRYLLYHFFTIDTNVILGCDAIWFRVTFYFWFLGIFGVNMGIATGLGQQWILGIATIIFLWFFGLPISYYTAVVQQGGIETAWFWFWPPYVGCNVVLFYSYLFRTNWNEIAYKIQIREGITVKQ